MAECKGRLNDVLGKYGAHMLGYHYDARLLPSGRERRVRFTLGHALIDEHPTESLKLDTLIGLQTCANDDPDLITGEVVEFWRQRYTFGIVIKVYAEVSRKTQSKKRALTV